MASRGRGSRVAVPASPQEASDETPVSIERPTQHPLRDEDRRRLVHALADLLLADLLKYPPEREEPK